MKKFWPILKWILIVWGIVCLAAAIVGSVLITRRIGTPGNVDRTDFANKQDVRFVLNWCGLGDDRIEKVIHSYRSARSLTGDHLDAYAIKICHVDLTELVQNDFGSGWYRGDRAEGVLKDALNFIAGWLHRDEIFWFPTEAELRSSDMYVYPWSIYCHGVHPSAVELIFIRPEDRMVFFISVKT